MLGAQRWYAAAAAQASLREVTEGAGGLWELPTCTVNLEERDAGRSKSKLRERRETPHAFQSSPTSVSFLVCESEGSADAPKSRLRPKQQAAITVIQPPRPLAYYPKDTADSQLSACETTWQSTAGIRS